MKALDKKHYYYCCGALLLLLKNLDFFLFQFKVNYLLLLKILPEQEKTTLSLPTGLAKILVFSYVMLWFLPAVVSSRGFQSCGFSPVINISAEKMKRDKAEQCSLWLKTRKKLQ